MQERGPNPRYRELCIAAERLAFRVHLHLEGRDHGARLSRLAVVDRDRHEVVALTLDKHGLEGTAIILLRYLRSRVR